MRHIIVTAAILLSAVYADPLGCCLPLRYSLIIDQNFGQLSPNDTQAQAIDVSTCLSYFLVGLGENIMSL